MEDLITFVKEFPEDEKVPAKLVAALLLQFTANNEKDYSVFFFFFFFFSSRLSAKKFYKPVPMPKQHVN